MLVVVGVCVVEEGGVVVFLCGLGLLLSALNTRRRIVRRDTVRTRERHVDCANLQDGLQSGSGAALFPARSNNVVKRFAKSGSLTWGLTLHK